MKRTILIIILLFSSTLIAQKKLIPVNASSLTGIPLPEGTKQDSRRLVIATVKVILESESKKSNNTIGETEVLVLPSGKKSGYTADSLLQSLTRQGWQVFPLETDKKYAWLQKDDSFLLTYFSINANTTDLYFGKPGSSPVFSTAGAKNPGAGSSSAESKRNADSANYKFNGPVTGIQFKAPVGWITQKKPDGTTTLESPVLSCKQNTRFTIYILGYYPVQNNLQQQAIQYFESLFNGNGPNIKMQKGVSEGGWEYFMYQTDGFIGKNDHLFHYPGIYLAKINNKVAVLAFEANRTEYKEYSGLALEECKEMAAEWDQFTTTIKFDGLQNQPNYMPDDLIGKWESRKLDAVSWGGLPQSQVLNQYQIFSNGTYTSYKIFNGSKGGDWKISGNTITFSGTSGKSTSYRFKLVSEFSYGSWSKTLFLYDGNDKALQLLFKGE